MLLKWFWDRIQIKMQLTALTTTAAECQRILRNPYRGHSQPCLDFNSRVLACKPENLSDWFSFGNSKTDLRSGVCARKSATQCCALLRWYRLTFHVDYVSCALVRNQDSSHRRFAPRTVDFVSLCSRPWLVVTRTTCSDTRLSENYVFLPLPQPCMNPFCRKERKACVFVHTCG